MKGFRWIGLAVLLSYQVYETSKPGTGATANCVGTVSIHTEVSRTHHSVPIGIETLGAFDHEALCFIKEFGHLIMHVKSLKRQCVKQSHRRRNRGAGGGGDLPPWLSRGGGGELPPQEVYTFIFKIIKKICYAT